MPMDRCFGASIPRDRRRRRYHREVLAADGGDLGKAFADLAAAFKAGDKVRAAGLLDPLAWNLNDKQPSWFEQFVDGTTETFDAWRAGRLQAVLDKLDVNYAREGSDAYTFLPKWLQARSH